jgi:hypothetical protein
MAVAVCRRFPGLGFPACTETWGAFFAGASTVKKAISCCSSLACSLMASLAAAISSTMAAFCCVTSSIWIIALFICSIPVACSRLAAAISATTSLTFLMLWTISSSAFPGSPGE